VVGRGNGTVTTSFYTKETKALKRGNSVDLGGGIFVPFYGYSQLPLGFII